MPPHDLSWLLNLNKSLLNPIEPHFFLQRVSFLWAFKGCHSFLKENTLGQLDFAGALTNEKSTLVMA